MLRSTQRDRTWAVALPALHAGVGDIARRRWAKSLASMTHLRQQRHQQRQQQHLADAGAFPGVAGDAQPYDAGDAQPYDADAGELHSGGAVEKLLHHHRGRSLSHHHRSRSQILHQPTTNQSRTFQKLPQSIWRKLLEGRAATVSAVLESCARGRGKSVTLRRSCAMTLGTGGKITSIVSTAEDACQHSVKN